MKTKKETIMKKVILAVVLTLAAGLASAQGRGYGYGYGWQGGGSGGGSVWVPLIVGGTVGYLVSQAQRPPVYIQQQPVYVQQVPVPVYSTPYTSVPPGYHYENLMDANCGCFRTVLVPN
jgi:hypothetical protein